MIRDQGGWFVRAFAGLVALVAGAGGSHAAQQGSFYAGKTLTIIVGTDESGGFSIYSRLIGNYLAKYIPGGPSIVVENMPGAGGSKAAAYLYNQAPRDGTTIASLTPDSIMGPLFGRQTPIDATRFSYIAGAERSIRVCVNSGRSNIKTFAQAMDSGLVIGATQIGGPTADYANFIKRGTHAKFKIVLGYSGVGSLYLALQRGEIDGLCGLDWAALKAQQAQQLRDKQINLLLQVDVRPDPELTSMGAPQPWSYMHNDLDRRAAQLMVNFQQAFGKAFVAPPNVPREQLTTLEHAFAAAMNDKQLLVDAKKMQIDIDLISGAEIRRTVTDLYEAAPDVISRLKEMTGAEGVKE